MRQTTAVLLLSLIMLAMLPGQAQNEKKEAAPPPPEPNIKVGDTFPDFTLIDQNRNKVSLHDFKGKKNVALAFVIFAFTGGWTTEMQNFQKNLQKLEAADTQVLGVSMDSPFSNAEWAKKEGFNFPILSDWGGDLTKQVGIFNNQYHAARRVTFLIDKDGKVLEMQKDRDAVDPTAVVTSCERRKLKS